MAGVTFAAVQLLRQQVFGLGEFHPSGFALAAVVLAIVSAAAAAGPARRVMRTGPLEAMRQEGVNRGVSSTPTFEINGRRYEGFTTYDEMRALVDQALAKAK